MAIRSLSPGQKPDWSRNRRKADQHWDMAGLARQDGDKKDEKHHTKLAREYEAAWREEKASE